MSECVGWKLGSAALSRHRTKLLKLVFTVDSGLHLLKVKLSDTRVTGPFLKELLHLAVA